MNPRSREEILAIQSRRTDRLVNGEDSPVPEELRRRGFKGLEYFPIDSKYQFKLKLHKYDQPSQVHVSLSNGDIVGALRVGFFEFELGGRTLRLQAYKKQVDDREMFLWFKDGTSGKDTYEAGRYLDIERDSVNEDYVLDFNLSYSPPCMFDPQRFVCPIPPRENWMMDTMIKAGEKRLVN